MDRGCEIFSWVGCNGFDLYAYYMEGDVVYMDGYMGEWIPYLSRRVIREGVE